MVAYARLFNLFVVPAGYVCFSCPTFGGAEDAELSRTGIINPSSEEYKEAAGDIPFQTTTLSTDFYFIQATTSPVLLLSYVQQVESNLI